MDYSGKYIYYVIANFMGFPGGSVVKNPSYQPGDMGSIPGQGRSPGKKWQPTLVFLPWKSH